MTGKTRRTRSRSSLQELVLDCEPTISTCSSLYQSWSMAAFLDGRASSETDEGGQSSGEGSYLEVHCDVACEVCSQMNSLFVSGGEEKWERWPAVGFVFLF